MIATTLETFRAELAANGCYRTPAARRAPERRAQGRWTTLRFTWAPFGVFPKCALYEAFGALTTDRWAHFCFEAVRIAERFGMTVDVEGWGPVRDYPGPVVFLANHMSTLETILLPAILLARGPFCTFAKESLLHLPFLGSASRRMGLIGLGRTSPRADLMKVFDVGGARIRAGKSMLLFPQGSRERVFSRKLYSSIGAKLAERAGVPVVPVAVKTDCEPTRPDGRGWFKDFGTVDPTRDIRVAFGPILTGKARALHEASFDWIAGKLEDWGLPTEGRASGERK